MPRIGAKVLLAGLFAVCVFRAITQSIVYDEALTYELYVASPLSSIFTYFDPNHHFLSTILIRLSTALFGVSEWSMRIPALAAAVLYFTAVYRLTGTVFGNGWTSLLAVAALSLNPLVLDFMVAARGYGLALALWMWALMLLLEHFSGSESAPRRLMIAGSCIALSVTANLVFALPAAALAGIAAYLLIRREKAAAPPAIEPVKNRKSSKSSKAKAPSKFVMPAWGWLALPIGAIALLYVLSAPIESAQASQFYTGAQTIQESLRSLASASVEHSGPLRGRRWIDEWRDVLAFGLGPLIVLGGCLFAVLRRNTLLLLVSGSAAISAAALLLLHAVRDMPYPADRTGIYFLPLVALTLAGLAYGERRSAGAARAVSYLSYAIVVALVLNFATEWNTRKFLVWEYDADTRSMSEYIARQRAASTPNATVRVGGSWQLWESLSFYRDLNRWNWMEVERVRPVPGYDYYALLQQDRAAETAMGVKEVYTGPTSGSVLTTPLVTQPNR